ncbi:RidA family protein [Cryobacterium sp. N21]|uniref:RidA family protein n=1 Tax=Cryobacterium sp. N21 TaxID=2048289 RepID=UPI000CE335AF|nr:RidA family protein [Cryobacterium sp. N21]
MSNNPRIDFLPVVKGRPFSSAVRVGDVLYLSGQIGTLPNGDLVAGFEAQARQTMENIATTLRESGLSMKNVFKATIMMDDMTRWEEFNEIYLEYFPVLRLPARSAFGADGLAMGAHLEVECAAYVPV